MNRFAPLTVAVLLTLLPHTALAQFPNIKLPGVKLPSLDNVFKESPPVTTSLSDAVTEVPSLDNFEPKVISPMRELPRGLNGGFLIMPGVWEMDVRSYCLHAGTYAPSGGTGHSYAPLKGPKAGIVRHILQNSSQHPEIPQRDVQVLLWAIIARTKFTEMPRGYQTTAAKLLTPKELSELDRNVMDILAPNVREKAFAKMPDSVKRIFEAENQLREKLTQATEAPFEDLERIAVLTGEAPTEPEGRQLKRGRWSYHPDGYFIRYFASSYRETKIQVYLPDKPFQLEKDDKGQILRVVWEQSKPAMVASAVPMAYSSLAMQSGRKLKEYDPSGGLAVPPGGGQRLGQSSGKPDSGPSPEEQKTRKMIGYAKGGRTVAGFLVKANGGPLTIPKYFFDKILDFNITNGFKIAEALAGDPPRPDFKIIAPVEKIPFTPLKAQEGLSPARATAVNAFLEASTDMNAKLRAATISLDRQGGALQAKDESWSDRQAQAIVYYKAESGKAMLVTADRLEALVKTLRAEGITALPVTTTDAKAYQTRLRDKGFTPEELAAAKQSGMTEDEIATLLKERIAADPQEIAGDTLATLTDSVEAMRWFGNRLATLPAIAPGD
jgi:hypothetical protein